MKPVKWHAMARVVRTSVTTGVVTGLLVTAGIAAPGGAVASPAPAVRPGCDAVALQKVVSGGTTVVSAKSLTTASTHTAYCRVDGTIATSGPAGADTINFQVSLPDHFNGRYLFLGIGGAAGAVTDPDEQQLADGWAQASTDARGPGTVLDYSFAVDRTKALDYASRGVHLTTVQTQAITKAYYGLNNRPGQLYRYVSGCSGGGRMGTVEASLYPSEYDGVLAGAPGTNSLNILKFGQIVDHLLRVPDSWVSPDQLQQLETAVIKKYDASDGAVDGYVRDPSKIDPSTFGSFGIFTPDQLALVNLITSDLAVGNRVYRGFSASNPTGWAAFLTGTTPPSTWATQPPPSLILFDTTTRGLFGANYDFRTQFNFSNPADLQKWTTTFDQVYPSQNMNAASFDAFRAKGGKILIWQGASDNGISVFDTTKLYRQIADHVGGFAAEQQSIRFFTVPGLFHCFGGPGAQDAPTQSLTALTKWVERGQAPQQIVVHSAPEQPTASFLLCPYPGAPVFGGGLSNPRHLNPLDAASWNCRV
jgi:hypothetical protein